MTAPPPAEAPRVAICVCTYGRSGELEKLFGSLREIDLDGYSPRAFELLVIDNRPDAETRRQCERAAQTLPLSVHYVEEPVPGLTYARNRAVQEALARNVEFVAFIDDDDRPRPDWLVRLLKRQRETGADLVFGTWVLDSDLPEWVRKSGIFRSPDKPKRNKSRRYGLPHYASGCNLLAGREILQRVAAEGPVFDHRFRFSGGEDKDFFLRAHRMGATLASADQSVIQRSHSRDRYTLRGLLRRGLKNGCSQVALAEIYADRGRRRGLLFTALFKLLFSLAMLPFSLFSPAALRGRVYRIAKCWGIIYASLTGRRIDYYSR